MTTKKKEKKEENKEPPMLDEAIIDKLEHNFLIDLLVKKDISTEERKIVITRYMKRNNIGIKPLARQLNIPFTSLYYWINPEKKKEQTHKYDVKRVDRGMLEELEYIDHTIKVHKKRIEDRTYRCNDKMRELISSIKDNVTCISYATLKIKD